MHLYFRYIVVPMHPEGDPASIPMQEMLQWQYQSVSMMCVL